MEIQLVWFTRLHDAHININTARNCSLEQDKLLTPYCSLCLRMLATEIHVQIISQNSIPERKISHLKFISFFFQKKHGHI